MSDFLLDNLTCGVKQISKGIIGELRIEQQLSNERSVSDTGSIACAFIIARSQRCQRMLIEETEISLSQVAEKIGCSGLANFSKMYKSYFGVSPKYYRRHLRTMEASRDKNS